ncbi:MCP four helix bundle domain-containing protein [Psychromonas sp. KJ10-10]|uniref:MCP four helix bundle domain-containing protein n=1 Tax=Psychromonas sp. KJ10-10 TaxID=3391823 RepID=UPI0039B4B981
MRAKLSLAMGLVSLCLIIMFLVYGNLTNNLNTGITNLGTKFMPSQSAILNADRDLYQAYVAQLIYIETASAEQKNDYEENAQQAFDRMKVYLSTLSDYPDISAKLTQFDGQFKSWKKVADQVLVLVDNNKKDEAYQLIHSDSASQFSKLRDLYDIAGEAVNQLAVTEDELLHAETQKTNKALTIFLCLVVILIIALTYFVPKMQVDGIRGLNNRIKEISEGDGDLTQRISSTRTDELGQLANTFDDFIAQLQGLIKELRESSDELNHNAVDSRFNLSK